MCALRSMIFLAPTMALVPLGIGCSQTTPSASQPVQARIARGDTEVQHIRQDPYISFYARQRSKYQDLPGHAIGVCVSDAGFDYCVSEGGTASNKGPLSVVFARGDARYRQLFWHADDPAKSRNIREPVAEKDGQYQRQEFQDVCYADTDSAKPKHIEPPFALVDIEVNGGAGSPQKVSAFVATQIKILHNTKEYPLNPHAVMRDALVRLQAYRDANSTALEHTFTDEAIKALGVKRLTGPRVTREHALITWLPETEHLQITLQTVTSDGVYTLTPESGIGTRSPNPAYISGPQFGMEGVVVLEYSKDGKLAEEKRCPLKEFVTNFWEAQEHH